MLAKNARLLILSISFLAVTLLFITIVQPYNNSPPIRSDGTGHHIWVHAIKGGTLNFCDHRALLGPLDAISMMDESKQKCGNKYPPGVGIIQTPFTALFTQANTDQGFSNTEHWLVLSLGSILLLGTALMSGKSLQNLGCKNSSIVLSSAAIIFGTGLFHYSTYDGSFSHIYSACLFSGTLLVATKKQDRQDQTIDRDVIIYAFLCMLLILTRQTNLILILGSSYILARNRNLTDQKKGAFALLSILATCCGIGFYIIYNYYHLGAFSLSTYGQEGVTRFAKHTLRVFASYERGLFTYYPICLLALAIGWISPKSRSVYLVFLCLIISYGLIYGSWSSWPLGGGFGHRGFVDMTPIMIIILGLNYDQIELSSYRRFWIPFISTLSVICIYITMTTQHAYWNSNYPYSGADQQIYWSTLINNPLKKE